MAMPTSRTKDKSCETLPDLVTLPVGSASLYTYGHVLDT